MKWNRTEDDDVSNYLIKFSNFNIGTHKIDIEDPPVKSQTSSVQKDQIKSHKREYADEYYLRNIP